MNCVELAQNQALQKPDQIAIWMPGKHPGRTVTYAALMDQAGKAQSYLKKHGIQQGDHVLLVDSLGPRLYAMVLAILGLGASVVLVEPWMPLQRIDEVMRTIKPTAFLAGLKGKAWGARVKGIRQIKQWLNVSSAVKYPLSGDFDTVPVGTDQAAILTFTSGTTGAPKGVVRTHSFLLDQHRILEASLHGLDRGGPDICIFANFTLTNLASGRTTLLMPSTWKAKHIKQLDTLPSHLKPESLTCGPAFLLRLMRTARIPSLRSIHVGGALTDCWIFEQGFNQWPQAEWLHVYGSTEAEPVAVCDARLAVQRSKEEGYFQTVCLGYPVPDIRYELTEQGAWVTGPHVCPRYIGNDAANKENKKAGPDGDIWHFMGDRIRFDAQDGLMWYNGRSAQSQYIFELEQRVYTSLQSSKSFIHSTSEGQHYLVGDVPPSVDIPGITKNVKAKIYRDRRHRARIDRMKSIARGASWLAS